MKVKVYEWLRNNVDQNSLALRISKIFNTLTAKVANGTDIICTATYNIGVRNNNAIVWGNSDKTYREYPISTTNQCKVSIEGNKYAFDDGEWIEREYSLSYLFGFFYKANSMISEVKADTFHLVPCLTSDNEACMIDLITGELYRNQGQGAFSVEGEMLYEFETPIISQVMRKPNVVVRLREWLKKDGYAYIPFDTNSGFDGVYEVDFASDSNCGIVCYGKNQTQPCLSISKGTNGWFWLNAGIHNADNWNTSKYGVLLDYPNEPLTAHIEVVGGVKKEAYIIQGGQKKYVDGVLEPYLGQMLSIFCLFEGRSTQTQKCGKAIVRGIHLHPCDLLYHPTLPPQSCMIDLNTGQLYTNQGSGQFSCEGEDLGIWTDTMFDDMRIKETKADMVVVKQDGEPRVVYERVQPFVEHRWLVGDGVAYIQLPSSFNESSWTYKHKIAAVVSFNNSFGGPVQAVMQIIDNQRRLGYLDSSQGNWVYSTTECGDLAVFKAVKDDGFYCNGEKVYTIYPPRGDHRNLLNAFYADVHEIVQDTLHLTPIHLTRDLFPHEIASSNTALRGECGFADKEKYKRGEPWFYGNRATSGSFSVSDED